MDNEIKNDQAQETVNEETTNKDEAVTSDETKNTEEQEQQVDNRIPYDRFKSKVDEVNALKERLNAFETEQQEAERKRLEEAEQYKQLAESYKQELESQKADVLNAKKETLLTQAGYTAEQVELLRSTVSGESDEEITKSIEGLKAVIAPKPAYVDPSPMNGAKDKPEPMDATEIGANAWERIKNKLR